MGSINTAQARILNENCTCPPGYYSAVEITYDCLACPSNGCATCASNSSCTNCTISTPARTGSLCQCPSGYYDDSVNA